MRWILFLLFPCVLLADSVLPPSTTPGGTTGQIQYNNAGAFGGVTLGSNLAITGGTLTLSNVALTTGNLSQFAPTTSAQLFGVVSDETGTGLLVGNTGAALNSVTINSGTLAGTNTVTGTMSGGYYKIGSGSDSSADLGGSTTVFITQNGATGLAVRNSTANVETYLYAGATGVEIGTTTNHPIDLVINNSVKSRWDTDGFIKFNGNSFGIGWGVSTTDTKIMRAGAGAIQILDVNGNIGSLYAGIVGITGTGNAATGNIGEYVSASVVQGSATALTTATPKTVASIVLTAGDWDITAIGCITGASTGTEFDVAIGTTTNSLTGTVLGDSRCQTPTVSLVGADASLMIPDFRASIASTGTYFLIVQETFTVGTPAAYGRISARRSANAH